MADAEADANVRLDAAHPPKGCGDWPTVFHLSRMPTKRQGGCGARPPPCRYRMAGINQSSSKPRRNWLK
jgi:hypothetical protein